MAPEYGMHGHFSVKSDVFSFGVLVLEIITGKSNNGFFNDDMSEDLLSHVGLSFFTLKHFTSSLSKLYTF